MLEWKGAEDDQLDADFPFALLTNRAVLYKIPDRGLHTLPMKTSLGAIHCFLNTFMRGVMDTRDDGRNQRANSWKI